MKRKITAPQAELTAVVLEAEHQVTDLEAARRLAASTLGRMAKGVKKTLTPWQRKKLAGRLAVAREKRWPKVPAKGKRKG